MVDSRGAGSRKACRGGGSDGSARLARGRKRPGTQQDVVVDGEDQSANSGLRLRLSRPRDLDLLWLRTSNITPPTSSALLSFDSDSSSFVKL